MASLSFLRASLKGTGERGGVLPIQECVDTWSECNKPSALFAFKSPVRGDGAAPRVERWPDGGGELFSVCTQAFVGVGEARGGADDVRCSADCPRRWCG